jgi:CheY-like chemotaxis protein
VTDQLRHEAFEHRARTEAEAANRAKDEFLAMLSHELRNPLQAITNSVVLLRQPARTDETGRRSLGTIERQTRHLTRLVNDLLDVTRVITGKIQLECRSVDLNNAISQCIEQLSNGGRLQDHTFELQTEPAWVHGDPVRLEQVILNLMINALRYTPSGGTIRLFLEHLDDEAIVRVEDNGVGIQPELLPRVFDAFVQGERSLERSQGGLGIGLTLVKRLVELHGGRVQAHSDGPGRGSLFVVRLPSIPAPGLDASAPRSRAPATDRRVRVLIVEDNADARESLCALLELDGHEVHQAADGEVGIELALRLHPDVVLVDIGLPRMDGYELARHLRARGAHSWLVAITGYGRPEDRQRSLEAGFDDHVVKPIDPDGLRRAVLGRESGDAPSGGT